MGQVWLTKCQALAIFIAEVAILRKTAWSQNRRASLIICTEILAEDRAHLEWIDEIDDDLARKVRYLKRGNALSGWFLGALSSLLPSRLACKLHAQAEAEATRIFSRAAAAGVSPQLLQIFKRARLQEQAHSDLFSTLVLAQSRSSASAVLENKDE